MRTTIDYGIDLGTTNSSISVLNGVKPEVIRNNWNQEITPSVVGEDKNGSIIVGKNAYERLHRYPNSTFSEFKLDMGKDTVETFEHSGKMMKPEELSAEVLKTLKRSVKQKKGEDIQAAVISVPAAFTLPQTEATNKAAQIAGLIQSPLVQEPVAAAMAYGFQDKSDKVFWFVYDLGGGTFDAAIIQVRDGVIQVVNHGGDNHLGGKQIDWEIVQNILVPAIEEEHDLNEFKRGNPEWRDVFAKLKLAAEKAKINLSWTETHSIYIDNLFGHREKSPVAFEYDLTREELEPLIEPIVQRTINIGNRVLEEKRLSSSDIEKCILVGGPTLTPYIRERLLDQERGLGIPLEYSIDPMTVVSQGAAIFAGTQKLKADEIPELKTGQYRVDLEYKSSGPDITPLVGGKVSGSERQDFSGYAIELRNVEAKKEWSTGKIPLEANGAFMVELWAEKGIRNVYEIELFNPEGVKQQITPNQLEYTVGQVITNPPLIHSMGVALANNEVEWFFEKGQPLPVKRRRVTRTIRDVEAGDRESLICIPVVEGEKSVADRNDKVGELIIKGRDVDRNVPAGSNVEVTIEIDSSRLVHTKAYIPILDAEFEEVIELGIEELSENYIKKTFTRERVRLEQLEDKAKDVDDSAASRKLRGVKEQDMVGRIDSAISASGGDSTALDEANSQIRELQEALDDVENKLEWPGLLAEAEEIIQSTEELLENIQHEAEDIQAFQRIRDEIREAIGVEDADLLRRKIREMRDHGMRVLFRAPGFWVSYLDELRGQRASMKDRRLADELFARADRAIQNNDLDRLQAAVRQLTTLLPQEKQEKVQSKLGYGSTLIG